MDKSVAVANARGWQGRMLVLIPLLAFLALAALFVLPLGAGDPSRIPSALIGHPAPRTELPPLPGLERDGKAVPGLDSGDFRGQVTVLNVWASWCVPCREQMPHFERTFESAGPDLAVLAINAGFNDTLADVRDDIRSRLTAQGITVLPPAAEDPVDEGTLRIDMELYLDHSEALILVLMNGSVRAEAVETLGQLRDAQARALLRTALTSKDAKVRALAAEALGSRP